MNEEIGGKKREANSVFMREDLDEIEGGGGSAETWKITTPDVMGIGYIYKHLRNIRDTSCHQNIC